MWIRSQDKESLLNCTGITIMENIIYGVIDGSERGTGELGRYVSKERVIEILDDIQNELCLIHTPDIYKDENPDGTYDYSIVYQMPQD